MRIRFTRPRRGTATAAVLCSAAAIATAACSAPAPATAMAVRAPASTASAAVTPVIVGCGPLGQRRPGEYPLTCAGTGATLAGLQWASWGPSAAFAAGREVVNDCVPTCVGGTGHAFPALVALWRAEPRPGHPGKSYFTRMAIVYTGSHSYTAGGKLITLPATVTYSLSSDGGGA